MAKWTNLERVWSSWNIFQLSSLKMLNFLTTFDKQFCGSTKPGDYYDKFMAPLAPPPPPPNSDIPKPKPKEQIRRVFILQNHLEKSNNPVRKEMIY